MTKRGRPYERVVAEVLKAMDRGASVQDGVWVRGPDGRRELDVFIDGTADGQQRRVLVECKDFNPKTTGPVGIGYVDALESKRRDLAIDASFICSNAGFTANAISKAKRVGVGLISVMRKRDERIRFAVAEKLYARKVKVEQLTIGLRGSDPIHLDGVPSDAVTYSGIPVDNWVVHRVCVLLGSNPIVKGTYSVTHKLKSPTEFRLPTGPVIADAIDFHLTITGGWFAHQITIDATGAIYDWLQRRIRLIPEPGQLHLQGVNIYEGIPISAPPQSELQHMKDLRNGEVAVALMLLEGLEVKEPVPDIDSLVEPADLDLIMSDLPAEAYTSVGA